MERMSKTMAEGKEDLERAFNIMNEELLKAEYKARVDYYGKSMNEIMEEVAPHTEAYKKLQEENKNLKEKNEKLEEDNINLISFNEHYSPDVIVKYEDRYETAYNEECIENAKLCDKMRRLEEENKKLKEEISRLRIELEQEKGKTGKKWTPATPYI